MDSEKLRLEYPALWHLLYDVKPFGCSDCPFAAVNLDAYPPNIADPDEGHYDCSLTSKKRIWGECPECSDKDWQLRAQEELARLVAKRD